MASMIVREVQAALKTCRNLTEIKPGKKHMKVFVGGRLAAVLSHGTNSNNTPRALQNTLACIRRADASCP